MVDFGKRLAKSALNKVIDPLELYETLDRASDKGPLRPAQEAILKEWHHERRNKKNVILKLHTGQGKTLIGLLILQSKINEGKGPAVYLCPNNFLVAQTCDQADQFGIPYCTAEKDLPQEFIDGKSILITSIQKLFNGLSRFKIHAQSLEVSSILMDDCHACIEAIKNAFTINLKEPSSSFSALMTLFAESLENQGIGTYADIVNKKADAFLLVPYWDWIDKQSEVAKILSKDIDNSVKFTWPIIKDIIQHCQCVISGTAIEISPYLPLLDIFGSYSKAEHRVFMSATITDDSFLVKGLGLDAETIQKPLFYKKEHWSGEKMLLIPSLIDSSLDRSTIVNKMGKIKKSKFGVVVLSPSFNSTRDWAACGATVATTNTIEGEIEKFKNGIFEVPLVAANRYDGIDLPDNTCRILIFDSKPYAESLVDRYEEYCLPSSEITLMKTARTIEQGLGRSVRGEKDYCVLVLIGEDLIKVIRSQKSRSHLSSQTRRQIEIGLDIAEMAKEEIEKGTEPYAAFIGLVKQSLNRDVQWKAFYTEKMEMPHPPVASKKVLEIFQSEREAELACLEGDASEAVKIIQSMIDSHHIKEDADIGWYLQHMARYKYTYSKAESNKEQIQAHKKNRFMLKPKTGMQVDLLKISQKRMEKIIAWIKQFENYEELSIVLEEMLSRLEFGVKADSFEKAFDDLGGALGFATERPDKKWKAGPDNLWCVNDGEYLLVECKNEVALDRADINKHECGQINTAIAWFEKHYPAVKSRRIMIIPTHKKGPAVVFSCDVEIMRKRELTSLKYNVRAFFKEFASCELKDLSEKMVQKLVNTHKLSVESLFSEYSIKPMETRA